MDGDSESSTREMRTGPRRDDVEEAQISDSNWRNPIQAPQPPTLPTLQAPSQRPPTPSPPAMSPPPVAPPTAEPALPDPPPPSGPVLSSGKDQSTKDAPNSTEARTSPQSPDNASSSSCKDAPNHDADEEAAKDDDPEDETTGKTGPAKRRGNPGNFYGTRLQYLEESLPAYVALPPRSKEREHWMRDFVPVFKELFPLDEYPMPDPKGLAPVEELSQEALDAMPSKERNLHNRKVRQREAGPDTRYTQSIKTWFVWRSTPYRQKDDAAVKRLLKELDRDFEAPRKRSLDHYVMSHPLHKDQVKQMSTETGSRDRLSNRRAAAKRYLEEMSEEDRQKIDEACQQEYEQAMEQWNEGDEELTEEEKNRKQAQASFGGAIQPILDSIRRVTGLSVVLFAGEWKGGDVFSSIQLESSPEGSRNLSTVQSKVYAAFGQTFLAWLVDAKRAEKPTNLDVLEAMPRSNALEELMRLVSNPFGSRPSPPQTSTDPLQSLTKQGDVISTPDTLPIPSIPTIPTSKPRDAFPSTEVDKETEEDESVGASAKHNKQRSGRKSQSSRAAKPVGRKKKGNENPKEAVKSKKGKGRGRKRKTAEESGDDDDDEMAFEGDGDGDADACEGEDTNEQQQQDEEEKKREEELEAVKNSKELPPEEYAKLTYAERMAYGQLRKKHALWTAFGTLNPSLTAYIAGEEPAAKPRPKKKTPRTKPTEPADPPRRSSRNVSSKSYKELYVSQDEDELEQDEPDAPEDQTASGKGNGEPEQTIQPVAEGSSISSPLETIPAHHLSDVVEGDEPERVPGSTFDSTAMMGASETLYAHPLQHPGVWKLALAFAESDEAFPVLEKQLEELLGPLYSARTLQPITGALFAAETDASAAVRSLEELRDKYMSGTADGIGEVLQSTPMQVDEELGGGDRGREKAVDVEEREARPAGNPNQSNEERDPTKSIPSPHSNDISMPPTTVKLPAIQPKPSFDISDPLGHEESRDISDDFGIPGASTSENPFRIPPLEAFEEFKSSSFTEDSKIHIKEFMDHLLDKDRGQEWKATVMKWVAIEEQWVDLKIKPQSLPTGTRPDGFDVWSKRGREKRAAGLKVPNNISYDDLRQQWGLYWNDINPEWRRREAGKVVMDVKDVEGDWSEFELPGRDGLALPLVFLRWWNKLAPETPQAKSEWIEALENVYFAYSCVFAKPTMPKDALGKRKAVDEGEQPPPVKEKGSAYLARAPRNFP